MSSANTGIEWTDKTWNPTTGCDKVSAGCKNCYAEAITERFTHNFPNGFKLTLHKDRIDQPRHWRKPSRIFVNSMSDLFHDKVPLDFLHKVFQVMNETPHHIYQILTKRHERLAELADSLKWSPNIWMGVSVESQKYVNRIDALRNIPAAVKFLSCEPLLGSLKLDLTNIDWVIVGGESGKNHRPIEKEWVEDILQQCQDEKVAFFFKQWGGITPKSRGKLLNGQIWQEMPIEWHVHLVNQSLLAAKANQLVTKPPTMSKVKAVSLV
jgi:protein gp37